MFRTKHQIRAVELTLGAPVILDDAKKRTTLLPLLLVLALTGHYKAPPPKKRDVKKLNGTH
jgi:hypothetical protein